MEYVMQTDVGKMKADGEMSLDYVAKRMVLTGIALAVIYFMLEV